jgi:hypothetical protein
VPVPEALPPDVIAGFLLPSTFPVHAGRTKLAMAMDPSAVRLLTRYFIGGFSPMRF